MTVKIESKKEVEEAEVLFFHFSWKYKTINWVKKRGIFIAEELFFHFLIKNK